VLDICERGREAVAVRGGVDRENQSGDEGMGDGQIKGYELQGNTVCTQSGVRKDIISSMDWCS